MMDFIRWHLFGTAKIFVRMHDGRFREGIARKFEGRWYGTPWTFAINSYRLNTDGTVVGDELVTGWEPCVGNIPFHPERAA